MPDNVLKTDPRRRALENVRALVDQIEREESTRRAWQMPTAVGLVVGVGLLALWFAIETPSRAPSAAEAKSFSCQLDVWEARSGEIERGLRKAQPEMSGRYIQKQLEIERPYVMAAAKVECDKRSK